MENFTHVKMEIFAPREYALNIRDELAKISVGVIGNYDHCVAIYPVQGYYRPLPGANPFDSEIGKISEAVEYKVEVNCKRELVNDEIKMIKNIHLYEGPLINIIPLANHLFGEAIYQSPVSNSLIPNYKGVTNANPIFICTPAFRRK